MKILISGSSGVVGRAVIQELLTTCETVDIYALTSHIEAMNYNCPNIHIIANKDIKKLLEDSSFDVMLHLAFPRNVSADMWAAGIEFSSTVLSLAKKYDVKRVINVSSQSIYGWDRKTAANEKDKIILTSPYTTGKYCTELLVNTLFYDRPSTNIRLSTIVGPTTDERVTNKFLSHIIAHENIIIRGGNQIFSFLDVRDAANGLVRVIKSDGTTWDDVYNLGTSESKSLLNIAEMAVEVGNKYGYSGTQIIVEKDDISMNNQLDVTAFKNDFKWAATHCIRDTMEYIFETKYIK